MAVSVMEAATHIELTPAGSLLDISYAPKGGISPAAASASSAGSTDETVSHTSARGASCEERRGRFGRTGCGAGNGRTQSLGLALSGRRPSRSPPLPPPVPAPVGAAEDEGSAGLPGSRPWPSSGLSLRPNRSVRRLPPWTSGQPASARPPESLTPGSNGCTPGRISTGTDGSPGKSLPSSRALSHGPLPTGPTPRSSAQMSSWRGAEGTATTGPLSRAASCATGDGKPTSAATYRWTTTRSAGSQTP